MEIHIQSAISHGKVTSADNVIPSCDNEQTTKWAAIVRTCPGFPNAHHAASAPNPLDVVLTLDDDVIGTQGPVGGSGLD